jgi:hypothetical protein
MEKTSVEEYLKQTVNEPELLDCVGNRSKPGLGVLADFSKPSPDLRLIDRYAFAHFRYLPAFIKFYREGAGDDYRQKCFELMVDFSLHHKKIIDGLYQQEPAQFSKRYFDNWLAKDAASSLQQADRVQAFIRTLAGFCKSIAPEDLRSSFESALARAEPLDKNWDRKKIPARELALIVLSLVIDHPVALMERYANAGAVPNQRFFGLASSAGIVNCFPEFISNQKLLKEVDAALNDFAKGAFAVDGGQLEQSFNYNLNVSADIQDLMEVLDSNKFTSVENLEKRRLFFVRLTVGLGVPTGGLPWKGTYTPPLLQVSDMSNSGLLSLKKNQVSNYQNGFGKGAPWPPAFTSITFPFSGYTALRSGWSERDSYLFMSDCRPARGHGSADVASIQINAFGRWLVVSGGSPFYAPSFAVGEQREHYEILNKYFEEGSSLKHNTITVDGLDQVKASDVYSQNETYTNPSGARFYAGKKIDFVESIQSAGWKDKGKLLFANLPATVTGRHERQVFFLRDENVWFVLDRVENLSSGEHQVEQQWIVPPSIFSKEAVVCSGFLSEQVKVTKNSLSTSDPSGANLFMHFEGSKKFEAQRHEGEKSPYLGWFSRGIAAVKVPTVQTRVTASVSEGIALIAMIGASSNTESPFVKIETLQKSEQLMILEGVLKSGTTFHVQLANRPDFFKEGSVSGLAKTVVSVVSKDKVRTTLILDGENLVGVGDAAKGDFELTSEVLNQLTVKKIIAPTDFKWVGDQTRQRPAYE